MVHFILYVRNQYRSTQFYSAVLQQEPVLNVPGMSEFSISDACILGLMPETGIQKILNDATPRPETGSGIPRCEIYLHVPDPTAALHRALNQGAILVEVEKDRDWGDRVAYCADPDGHILAFAKRLIR